MVSLRTILGRKIYATPKESLQRTKTLERLKVLLGAVDAKPLLGAMKAWLYNNAVVQQLSWSLMVYGFPISFVDELDALANSFIKKWFGLPLHGPNPVILYLPKKEKGFGMVKLTNYFKDLGVVREHLLKYSGDPVVRQLAERRLTQAKANDQKKWTAPTALDNAERGLVLDSLTAAGQTSLNGLGYGAQKRAPLPEPGSKTHREAVMEWNKSQNVHLLLVSLHELTQQQDWRQWDGVMAQDLSWNRMLYRMSARDIKFLLQGTLQIAPSPAYLKTIGKLESALCPLCFTHQGSFRHIESYCLFALNQGRFKWRHDEILRILHYVTGKVARKMTAKKVKKVQKRGMKVFVKEGEHDKATKTKKEPTILETACDWRITVDLPGVHYNFPAHIAITGERPDLVLWSETLKLVVLIELTVPSECNITDAHQRKSKKYGEPGGLCDEIRNRGWKVELMPVEVGVLGYIAVTTQKALKRVGIWTKGLETTLSEIALRCSYVIFVSHKTLAWAPWRMVTDLSTMSL